MPNINIKIRNKVAKADRAIIVCDNSDYVAHFDFDAEWDAYTTKTARFVYGGRYTDVVFSGNECPVPVIQDTRAVTVGVFAGDLHTTTPAYFACVPSILFGNGIPADPTPEVYAQIMELLGKISDESVAKAVTDALEQAKVSGEFDGEKGNDGVSPAVSVAAITGGNRVTITDAEGAKTFDVMDGAQGASGADGKDYVLTNADKQEIAKAAAGLVDVPSVQPDWNQNDSTQPDYVKNRPFYAGIPVETVLVEESTVPFAGQGGMYMGQLESTFAATVGETYKVYWDGTAYECTCVDFNNMQVIGNLSIVGAGSDTGEPFVIGVDNGKRIQILTADTSASHTISISGFVQEVVKIDTKYLPNTVATKSEVEVAQTMANNARTTANNAQTTANNAQTTANNAKSEALDLAARMFGHTSVVDNAFDNDKTLSITSLPACIESIGNSAFKNCTKLALTSLPSGLTSIGNSAFKNCTKLALTSLPSGLTSINNGAFFGCTKLALTSLPSGLTSIGFQVFSGCKNLALTSLPSGLTSIDSYAFSGCTKLALTSLPSGLTSIGSNAFTDCTNLALTSLPSGLTSIGYNAFYNCIKLALTSLPSGLTSIGNSAFYNCTKLTSITFTGKPTTISSSAFNSCSNLTTINVPWAEGEVANAPWGATNATINYNYTGA